MKPLFKVPHFSRSLVKVSLVIAVEIISKTVMISELRLIIELMMVVLNLTSVKNKLFLIP
jgi:hypothetical protein